MQVKSSPQEQFKWWVLAPEDDVRRELLRLQQCTCTHLSEKEQTAKSISNKEL